MSTNCLSKTRSGSFHREITWYSGCCINGKDKVQRLFAFVIHKWKVLFGRCDCKIGARGCCKNVAPFTSYVSAKYLLKSW